MNDTHGETGKGWYGFALDGTLAKYDGWKGIDHIGEPVKPMVDLMKRMHDEGKVVKIMTARVAPRLCGETHAQGCRCGHCEAEAGKPPVLQEQYLVELGKDGTTVKRRASDYVRDWCADSLGFIPEIVYQKDHLMLELYDDRVKQVEPNTGVVIADRCAELEKRLEEMEVEVHVVRTVEPIDLRWASRMLYMSVGFAIGWFLFIGLQIWLNASAVPQRELKLHDALREYLEASKAAAVIDTAKGACGWTR